MNSLEDEVFKKSIFHKEKLEKYGFIDNKYQTKIDDFDVLLEVNDNKLAGHLYEDKIEYTNFRVKDTTGYSSLIRDKYLALLNDIKEKCTTDKYFVSDLSNELADFIYKKYKIKPEFIFKDPTYGVFRNNGKWYGMIMNIPSNRLNLNIGNIDILNIKVSDNRIVNNKNIFPAYHMNKKSWVSIILDGSISLDKIKKLVDISYGFTVQTNEWIIPCNPNYFDVFDYVENNREVVWTQKVHIKENDIVYLYLSAPISSIIYKLSVVKTNIYNDVSDKYMSLKLIKKYDENKYPFKLLNEFGVRAIRGPRHIPKGLSDYMKKDD